MKAKVIEDEPMEGLGAVSSGVDLFQRHVLEPQRRSRFQYLDDVLHIF